MTLRLPPPNRRVGFVDALGFLGLFGLLVARFIPVARLFPFWRCWVRELTGWPCLGCGLTRAADRFAHGNLTGAFAANPLGAAVACCFVAAALMALLHLGFRVPVPEVSLSRREQLWARATLASAVVLNWVFLALQTRAGGLL